MYTFFVPRVFLLVVFVVALTVPATSHAYKFIDEQAYVVNESLVMFFHTFSFGVLNGDAYLSYQASASAPDTRGIQRTISYQVVEDDETYPDIVTATAAVLSSAPAINGLYRVDKGQPATFTLVSFVEFPETDVPLTDRDLSLELTQLPFTIFAENSIRQFFYPLKSTQTKE